MRRAPTGSASSARAISINSTTSRRRCELSIKLIQLWSRPRRRAKSSCLKPALRCVSFTTSTTNWLAPVKIVLGIDHRAKMLLSHMTLFHVESIVLLAILAAIATPLAAIDRCESAVRAGSSAIDDCVEMPSSANRIWDGEGNTPECSLAIKAGRNVIGSSDLPEAMIEGMRHDFYARAAACLNSLKPSPRAPEYNEEAECERSARLWC